MQNSGRNGRLESRSGIFPSPEFSLAQAHLVGLDGVYASCLLSLRQNLSGLMGQYA